MKLLTGWDPIEGGSLASQPTLSRFENAAGRRDLVRLCQALAEAVIARHKRRKKRVRRITIELDPTDDPSHGGQQLTFFVRFYDIWCYLPLAGFLTFDDEVEQYLFCYFRGRETRLRDGHGPKPGAYRASSWPHERRVIVKAEVAAHFGRAPKDNRGLWSPT